MNRQLKRDLKARTFLSGIVAALGVCLFSGEAPADGITITVDFPLGNETIYERTDEDPDIFKYKEADALGTVSQTFEYTGIFVDFYDKESETFEEPDQEVIGVTLDGYSFVELRKKGKGKAEVAIDFKVFDEFGTYGQDFDGEVEFINGTSWEDYVEGRDVELRYTEEGLKKAQEEVVRTLQEANENQRELHSLACEEVSLELKKLDFKILDLGKSPSLFRVNLTQLTWIHSSMSYQIIIQCGFPRGEEKAIYLTKA